MNRNWMIAAVVVLCAASFMVGNVVAQEQGGGGGGAGMQMPAWMQMTKEHEGFKKSVGDWNAKMQFWMAPGQPPMAMEGEATYELMFGGKFLTQNFKSAIMGQPFTGHMLLGFDTIRKEFVSIWIDSSSPFVNIYRGTEKDGVLHLAGQEPDMMTGKLRDTRHTVTWQGDDSFTYAMFAPGPDGKEFKAGEIVYSRAK